jgi:O-acetyl-ADP-ribose deacetylase
VLHMSNKNQITEYMEIHLIKGDITKINTDCIVNAAKNSLLGGGGVDGAIHRAGGNSILEECILINQRQGGCPTGEAVITTAGKLPSKFVLHTVGPIYEDGNHHEPELLKKCYTNSLKIASEHHCHTVAFSNISTGVYGYPKAEAAEIAIKTVKENSFPGIQEVQFICFDEENYTIYDKLLHTM